MLDIWQSVCVTTGNIPEHRSIRQNLHGFQYLNQMQARFQSLEMALARSIKQFPGYVDASLMHKLTGLK